MQRMNDPQIRAALKRKILKRDLDCPNTLVVDELGLRHGAGRIDVAVVNGRLHGYEIKSDRDTLARLPDQIRLFSAAIDRITLVVGWRHVVSAMRVVPRWWGVTLAEHGARGGIHFAPLRLPESNPEPDPSALVALLWRNEALCLLEGLDAADGVRSKPKAAIYARLANQVPDYSTLRQLVCQQLRRRTDWRPASPSE
jgi:hypothetical protein